MNPSAQSVHNPPAPLAIIEIRNGRPAPGTDRLVAAAAQWGPATLLVAGDAVQDGPQACAEMAAHLQDAACVWTLEHPTLALGNVENLAPVVAALAADFTHLIAPGSTFGRDLLARAAALLGVEMASDVVALPAPDRFVRPIHAGALLATVRPRRSPALLTVRLSAFEPAPTMARRCPIRVAPGNAEPGAPPATPTDLGLSTHLGFEPSPAGRPDLTTAEVVVCGGQGLEREKSFAPIEALADALGGAVGATRSAVDAGLAPNDWQVGQTGKMVGPRLYIGAGVSGAIQHLAGIKEADVIVAINNDPDAPIFGVADLGLEADLFEAIPQMVGLLGSRKRGD